MIAPEPRSKIGWNSTKNSPEVSSSASHSASTSRRARGSVCSRLIASHLVWRMSSGATRTRSASGPRFFSSSSRKISGVRSTRRRRARPYIGARAQLRPHAAATARSASSPSGRTNTARAFRQRSSRPRVWPSRTLPETFTAFDSTPRCATRSSLLFPRTAPSSAATTLASASVVVSPRTRPSAMSRSSRRMILPERVFGRSATKKRRSGRAIAPIFFATWLRTADWRSVSACACAVLPFSLRITNAAIAVPFSSSATPTTAASATAGWSTSADSTSIVPIRWPATFITSSTRPRSQK